MSRLYALAHQAGRARKLQRRLRNIVPRMRLDPSLEFFPLLLCALRPNQHPIPAGFPDRLHHQLVQVVESVLPLRGIVIRNVSTLFSSGSSPR